MSRGSNVDTKTAFDVARPRHIANILGDQDVHGWITVALRREMAGSEGQATFENVDSTFPFHKMHPSRKRRSSSALAHNGHADPGECRA